MAIPISGQQPIMPKQAKETQAHTPESTLEAATSALKDAAQIFDTESQGVSKSMLKQSKVEQHQPNQTEEKPGASTVYAEAVAAMEESDEVDQKKKKKLTAWEQKLEELAALEGALNEAEVPEEERGVIKQFFDNMAKIRGLKRRLKQVQQEKEQLKKMLSAEKERQKYQKRG